MTLKDTRSRLRQVRTMLEKEVVPPELKARLRQLEADLRAADTEMTALMNRKRELGHIEEMEMTS